MFAYVKVYFSITYWRWSCFNTTRFTSTHTFYCRVLQSKNLIWECRSFKY